MVLVTAAAPGSANINQRSMGGRRDTEIAMGACQLTQKAGQEGIPSGEIAQFRKSLFIEHLNKVPSPAAILCGRFNYF